MVTVEAPCGLDEVTAAARALWTLTDHPEQGRGSVGFVLAERGSGPLPAELTLPTRMTGGDCGDS